MTYDRGLNKFIN